MAVYTAVYNLLLPSFKTPTKADGKQLYDIHNVSSISYLKRDGDLRWQLMIWLLSSFSKFAGALQK